MSGSPSGHLQSRHADGYCLLRAGGVARRGDDVLLHRAEDEDFRLEFRWFHGDDVEDLDVRPGALRALLAGPFTPDVSHIVNNG